MLRATSSRLRLKIIPSADNTKALGQFDRKLADLAVLRTDARIPSRARSIAILEHDVFMLISPGDKKIKSLAELKKKKIALLTSGSNNLAFVRKVARNSRRHRMPTSRLQLAPPNSTLDKLFASGGYGAVIAVDHASAIVRDKGFEQSARARAVHGERHRRSEGVEPALSRHVGGNAGYGPVVLDAADSRRRSRHGRTAMVAGRSGHDIGKHRRRAWRARSTRTRRSLRSTTALPPRSSRPTSTRRASLSRPSGRRRIYQRHLQIVPGALQRPVLSGRGRAQRDRLDLCRALHQGHAGRAGKGQRARHRHPRYRRADSRCPDHGGARRPAGRTRRACFAA